MMHLIGFLLFLRPPNEIDASRINDHQSASQDLRLTGKTVTGHLYLNDLRSVHLENCHLESLTIMGRIEADITIVNCKSSGGLTIGPQLVAENIFIRGSRFDLAVHFSHLRVHGDIIIDNLILEQAALSLSHCEADNLLVMGLEHTGFTRSKQSSKEREEMPLDHDFRGIRFSDLNLRGHLTLSGLQAAGIWGTGRIGGSLLVSGEVRVLAFSHLQVKYLSRISFQDWPDMLQLIDSDFREPLRLVLPANPPPPDVVLNLRGTSILLRGTPSVGVMVPLLRNGDRRDFRNALVLMERSYDLEGRPREAARIVNRIALLDLAESGPTIRGIACFLHWLSNGSGAFFRMLIAWLAGVALGWLCFWVKRHSWLEIEEGYKDRAWAVVGQATLNTLLPFSTGRELVYHGGGFAVHIALKLYTWCLLLVVANAMTNGF